MVRIWRMRAGRRSAVAYAVTAIALWPVPLLNVLHAESCALFAGVAFLVAGLSTLQLREEGVSVASVVGWQVGILLLPLALMTVPVLWAPNCSYATGLLLFALFPGISAVLASSLAYLIGSLGVGRRRTLFVVLTLATAVLTPLYDLSLYPQLYTYNHVFGGVLGPIYDEQLAIRPGLFAFRLLGLLWAFVFFLAGRVASARPGLSHPLTLSALAASVVLVVAYAFSPSLGWNTTETAIQDRLGEADVTEHFEIFYDRRSTRRGEIGEIADELEYRYSLLARRLDTEVGGRIRIYLYPTESVKGELTGSRSTSVAPVWLGDPQIHILKRRARQSLDHELVHVFAREFGLPGVRASLSVGLVEGLAAALEAPDGGPSSSDLMVAVIQGDARDSVTVVEGLTSALGAFGFWTGRGAVSYAATGSFVRYILDEYGVEPFKSAYPLGDLESAYGKSTSALAGEWYTAVRRSPPVSAAALPAAEVQFAVPSLFETECPHAVPNFVSDYREGIDHLSLLDTLAAARAFERSLEGNADYLPSTARLASIRIRQGDYRWIFDAVAEDTVALKYPQMMIVAADAFAMAGRPESALELYDRVQELAPEYAIEYRLVLRLRQGIARDSVSARWFFDGGSVGSLPGPLQGDPALPLYRTVRSLARDRPYDACAAARSWTPAAGDETGFAAQALLWKAEACVFGAEPAVAAAAGDEAAALFRSVEQADLARFAADRADFARWKLSRTRGRTSPTSSDLRRDSSGP